MWSENPQDGRRVPSSKATQIYRLEFEASVSHGHQETQKICVSWNNRRKHFHYTNVSQAWHHLVTRHVLHTGVLRAVPLTFFKTTWLATFMSIQRIGINFDKSIDRMSAYMAIHQVEYVSSTTLVDGSLRSLLPYRQYQPENCGCQWVTIGTEEVGTLF